MLIVRKWLGLFKMQLYSILSYYLIGVLCLTVLLPTQKSHAGRFEDVPSSSTMPQHVEIGIGAETRLPIPRFAALKSDNVYVRTGPSMDYPIRWIYKRAGLPVEIIQEFDAWRRIKDPDGETGWVHKLLLTGRRSAIIRSNENIAAYSDNDLVSPIALLEPHLIVNIHECDFRACFASFSPYEGWIEKKFLWGVYGSEIFH